MILSLPVHRWLAGAEHLAQMNWSKLSSPSIILIVYFFDYQMLSMARLEITQCLDMLGMNHSYNFDPLCKINISILHWI